MLQDALAKEYKLTHKAFFDSRFPFAFSYHLQQRYNLISYTYSSEPCVLYRSLCSFRKYSSCNALLMTLIRHYSRMLT
ncbi:hypothetical protein P618_200144 [Holospora obtusa F1]|uniref:Uncharacterized protein n=1 Tax=Holospora obtusa F1 TaxID=1399147 RepID=W6TI43_HOLOB|nr:hypothetical protein P618_200144 [Holospora obtusa F1]